MDANTTNNNQAFSLTKQQITEAKKYCKKYGTSYFLASRFFGTETRHATWVLYAFVRIPDEIVDTEKITEIEAQEKLTLWKNLWEKTYHFKDESNQILVATRTIFLKYNIPFEYSTLFIDAMIQDTEKSTYANYQELKKYMYGSACVVGLMMSHVIGYEKDALDYAEKLGYAMQLTNFLRDIDEDWVIRKRIYVPIDELEKFRLSTTDIQNKTFSEDWVQFMKFQTERASMLYTEANQGIQFLDKKGQRAVRLASYLYAGILKKIEQQNYNIWNKRVRTTVKEKIQIVIQYY